MASATPPVLTEAWSTAREAAKNAGAKKIMKNSENEHNSLWRPQKKPNKNPSESACLHYGNFAFSSKCKDTV